MKKRRLIIGVLIGILLLGVLFNSKRIGEGMFHVYSSVIKHQTRNAESFWFRHVDIDSLYKENRYKYFVFIKNSPDKDTLSVPQDSVLIIKNSNLENLLLKQKRDVVSLPQSAFDYLLKEEQAIMMYVVDSVDYASSNRYKIRKVKGE